MTNKKLGIVYAYGYDKQLGISSCMSMTNILEPIDSICVGIDFGTTNSLVAVFDGTFEFINFDGQRMLLSIAKYPEIGVEIKSIKRIVSNLSEINKLPFESKIENGQGYLFIKNEWWSVISICADILRYMRYKTNIQLNRNVKNAVITVPARFDEYQRQCIIEAATEAGWKVARVLAEPTAGFISQNLSQPKDSAQNIYSGQNGVYGIYDLGGGTFDFSIIRKEGEILQVIGTTGDTSIGGDYFDAAIAEALDDKYTVNEVSCMRESGDLQDLTACEDMINRSIDKCKELINQTGETLNQIIVIGGGAHMNAVIERIRTLEIDVCVSEEPQLAVVKGAAIHGYRLMHDSIYLLLDVTPLSLGVETMHGMVEWIIKRNSPLPTSRTTVFTNASDKQTHITFNVVQGEGMFVEQCRSLGHFKISIKPQRPHSVRVEVQFTLDMNGMLSISCKDLDTEELNEITFHSGHGLTQNMINRILSQSTENVVDKENYRRFYKLCGDIDIILRALEGESIEDYNVRREKIKIVEEAEALMNELESSFGPIIQEKLNLAVENIIKSGNR